MTTRVVNNHAEPCDVRIARPSRWGNPYRIGDQHPAVTTFTAPMNRDHVIALFREYALGRLQDDEDWLEPLRGKVLGCWCKPLACHGDVIVELLEVAAGGSAATRSGDTRIPGAESGAAAR